MAKKILKKAQDGTELRKGQYKRIGRIAERNPERAERVAERMNTRASRVDRGKEIASPSIMSSNPVNEMQQERRMDSQFKRQALRDTAKGAMEGMLKKKMGGMIKRADGSMSKRGLWDNIRANKGSGKKPTSEMLKQERKIKGKKAEGGVTLAKDPNTDPKNSLNFTTTKENKNLSDVTKRETAGEALKGFYKKDYLGADKAKTTTGKTLRKVGNTAIKAAYTPQALMATVLRAGSTAKANKAEGNKAELDKKKMGGKLKPVDKTKKPGLAKLPTAVRNKMGFKKNGGVMSKKK